jgi:uncharacterized SAM-binding protein YcdF (DUF218 family)
MTPMFVIASVLAFATQPLAWALLLLTGSLVLGRLSGRRFQTWARRLGVAAFVALFVTGWLPPVDALMNHLESQSTPPDPAADLSGYAGLVVLGGALESSSMWEYPGRIALNAGGERMVVAVALMQRNPHLHMLFTGGEGNLRTKKYSEADRAKIFFDLMDVDPKRVSYESKSRTTYDNAVLSAQVPGIDIKKPWLLVTTAAHMPRSLAVFKKNGWNVTPYMVDFRTAHTPNFWFDFSFPHGAEKWHYALHEIIGYWAYRATGKI